MLAHLLESNAQRNCSVWGALASTAGHTVVIAVAVFATAEPTSDHRTGVPTTEPFTADQVDRQVYLRPGSRSPRYPDALRARGVEGQVVALFVVNERGRAELGSVRFTRSDNALFEAAVRDVLATLQFSPAEVGGRKVAQLVQMPFVFTLSR